MCDKIDRENRLQEKEAKKNTPQPGRVKKPAAAPVVEAKTETKE